MLKLRLLSLGPVAMIAACGDLGPAETAQMDAVFACYELAEPLLDEFAEEHPQLDDELDAEVNWRVGDDGHFVAEILDPRPERTSTFLYTCAGNMNERTIEFIQFGQNEMRPATGEIWSF